MPLIGQAFVIMRHDIVPQADAEYHWHTREHMPERIALPGFLRAHRGLDRQRYFTLYEGASLQSFVSDAYLRRMACLLERRAA